MLCFKFLNAFDWNTYANKYTKNIRIKTLINWNYLFLATQQTIEMCNIVAADKTADAALIVSPSFYKGQMTVSIF